MGDKSVDNIQGIPGKGPAAAKAILWNCDTEEEMYEATFGAYVDYEEKAFKKTIPNGEPTQINHLPDIDEIENDAKEALIENARLLWMLREPLLPDRSNLWVPPTDQQ
jgi:5'-3' exonuclease